MLSKFCLQNNSNWSSIRRSPGLVCILLSCTDDDFCWTLDCCKKHQTRSSKTMFWVTPLLSYQHSGVFIYFPCRTLPNHILFTYLSSIFYCVNRIKPYNWYEILLPKYVYWCLVTICFIFEICNLEKKKPKIIVS